MIKVYLEKVKSKLKEEKGASMTIMNWSFILVLFLIIIIAATLCTIYTLQIQSRSLIEEATVSTIQNNYANVYHTSRESYSGGYLPNDTNFSESVIATNDNVYNTLVENMGFVELDNKTYAKLGSNDNVLYKIKDINLSIKNENIRSGTKNFVATVDYTFVFPIQILSYQKDLEIEIRVKAKHTGKY